MSKLQLRILLPSREAVSKPVDAVNLVAVDGEVGILPGHAAYLAALQPGAATLRDGHGTERWALGDGFVEVHDDVVTVLVQSAEHAGEIDVERARRRRQELEKCLADELLPEAEARRAELSLRKQTARLQAAGAATE